MNCKLCGYGGTDATRLHDECPAPWEPSKEALEELADRKDMHVRSGIIQHNPYKRSH